jgi:hypothetical protein
MESAMTTAIHPEVRIGHVHLTVSNLERAVEFYRDALGFEVTQRYGDSAVIITTLLSTPGPAKARPNRRRAGPAFITWRFYIQLVWNWPAHSSACSTTAWPSKAPPITASVKPFTSAIRMETVSSSTTTARATNGRAMAKICA